MDKDKYVLITGGTMGIGYELARCFAEENYNLVLVARSKKDLQNRKKEFENNFGIKVLTISTDLFNPENATKVYREIKANKINIEILVNNAGQGVYGEFSDTDIKREISIINLNISSLVILTKLFVKEMKKKGSGKILNVSSIASKSPGPFQSVYHATKAFVQSFTEAIRDELKDSGITITALLPGATDTDFFNKADMTRSKVVVEGKLADPAKVAEDGFLALMSGNDKVIFGITNKVNVLMSNLMPESTVARMVHKQQEPVTKNKIKSPQKKNADKKPIDKKSALKIKKKIS